MFHSTSLPLFRPLNLLYRLNRWLRPSPAAAIALAAAVSAMALTCVPAQAESESGFPVHTLQPKKETGLDRFLAAHPNYDGRGTVVAIFDTGIDPGAPGLQVTSEGKPKIIDLIDGSGSGDVRTDIVRKPQEDGTLEGLTGRTLTLGEHKSHDGEYYLGMKSAWDIYPRSLIRRVKAERRLQWDEEQRVLLARVRTELEEWETEHPSPSDSEKPMHDELKLRVELLEKLQKDYDDPGPVFDCVVFNDGTHWRAIIDTDEDGDLAEEKAMTNFRIEREWSTFDDKSLLNFGVNIYEDGNLLSIVADCGAHGTHVAGTVAAHHPGQPERNGMAPGAQIIGVKIGDTRLGASSLETGESRGIITALENECDLVNMSYGGVSPLANEGHINGLFDEFVYDHGVIFVSSAGNAGPGLSSAGSPGATTESLISVGAFVSGEMMTGQDALREPLPDTHYTWSSRGPTVDGALGPDFSAPGGAISPVPNWILQPNTLMHGTSMASPNVCGGIACLVSGLKAEGLSYTQQLIRRALANTATGVEATDKFALGAGLVQFDKAWELLQTHRPYSPTGVRFEVALTDNDVPSARGIYLREPWEVEQASETNVTIRPEFRREIDNHEKVDFELEVALKSTVSWVDVPDHLLLHAGGRSFRVLVDPRGLAEGVHYAEILGTDLAAPGQGPIFRVPVTVIVPTRLDASEPQHRETLPFAPGEIHRRFFAVPEGATWADLVVRAGEHETDRSLIVHTVQLEPGKAFSDNDHRSYGWMSSNEERIRSFEVIGGRTLEVALAHSWSSIGPAEFAYEIIFHGLVPSERSLMIDGALPTRPVSVTATLSGERIQPKAKLTHRRLMLRPKDSELRALPGTRDLLPRGRRVHSLLLTYEFELEKKAKAQIVPGLYADDRFWERWQSGLWMIFDEGKQHIATGPRGPIDLEKGTYTLQFHLRHTDPGLLEAVEDFSLGVDLELGSPISLSVYSDPVGAIDGGRKFGSRELKHGEMATLWIGSPVVGELPEGIESGDLLRGTVQFGQEQEDHIGSGRNPSAYQIFVRVPEKELEPDGSGSSDGTDDTADSDSSDDDDRDRDEGDELEDELRDLQIKHLATLREADRDEDFLKLLDRLLDRYPNELEIFTDRARFYSARLEDESATPQEVIRACNAVIERVDAEKIAATLLLEVDEEDTEGKEAQDEAKKTKGFLVEAHRFKCEALLAGGSGDEFEAAFRELDRWVDESDGDTAVLRVRRESKRGRSAKGLQTLDSRIEKERFDRELYELRQELFESLGWESWAATERQWLLRRMPDRFAGF